MNLLQPSQNPHFQVFPQLLTGQEWWSGSKLTSLRARARTPSLHPRPWVADTRPKWPTASATFGEKNWLSSNPNPNTAQRAHAKALRYRVDASPTSLQGRA